MTMRKPNPSLSDKQPQKGATQHPTPWSKFSNHRTRLGFPISQYLKEPRTQFGLIALIGLVVLLCLVLWTQLGSSHPIEHDWTQIHRQFSHKYQGIVEGVDVGSIVRKKAFAKNEGLSVVFIGTEIQKIRNFSKHMADLLFGQRNASVCFKEITNESAKPEVVESQLHNCSSSIFLFLQLQKFPTFLFDLISKTNTKIGSADAKQSILIFAYVTQQATQFKELKDPSERKKKLSQVLKGVWADRVLHRIDEYLFIE